MSSQTIDLDISGMTCSSCVNHVTRSLQSIEGVQANVNLATERASVVAPPTVQVEQLIQAVRDAGYQASLHGHEHPTSDHGTTLSQRLLVSAVLTLPVLGISMVPAWQFDYWQFLMFVLATPVVWFAGWPFHRSAWAGLRHGLFSMDTLVSVGTLAAWGWSTWAIMFGHAAMVGMRHEWSLLPGNTDASMNIYFETAAVLVTVILLGRWLEERSRRTAGAALDALAKLLPREVRVRADDGSENLLPRELVTTGMAVVVLPGETIPVDGSVIDGESQLNNAVLTGESEPIAITPRDSVLAGALVIDGRIVITATHVGDDTRIAQLTALVDRAQVAKSSVQRLADRISAIFVPTVLGLALLTGIAWWIGSGNLGLAFSIAIAVVIIACPCALGLATPVAVMAGTGRGAQLGIIISGPDAIERSGRIRTVYLDKTGTLTTGELNLQRMISTTGDENGALALLAGLERGSTHPIAIAVERAAAAQSISPVDVTGIRVDAGVGVSGIVDGEEIRAVALHRWTGPLSDALQHASTDTAVVLSQAGTAVALATFADEAKPDAAQAIAEIRALGISPVLLTGDRAEVANRVAAELGIDRVSSQQTPEAKLEAVSTDDSGGVAMVGDGINDAAALAAADLGIAIGTGTDLARAASDVTVLRADARVIPQAIRLTRATRRTIIGNLVWAFGYNVAAIPLAMAGVLGPMIAGAAMAFSSVFVVLNSVRLTRFK
ncbi:MAG: heavy metal translocating P-type ATPase [Agromyces sp.]